MDSLSASDIYSTISYIMHLYTLFKDRDSYLESCREYMNSFAESIKAYEASNMLNKEKALSYKGLKKELKEYASFLEKSQKKKNVVTRFFKGNDFIAGCEKYVERIQKWASSMNLNLHLRYGEETAKNFEELFKALERIDAEKNTSTGKFKDKFSNSNAASFWIKYFQNQEDVEWTDFRLNLKSYIFSTEKKELTDSVIDKISQIIDADGNKIVNYAEWDLFYAKIWNNFDLKAKFLMDCDDNLEIYPNKKAAHHVEETKETMPAIVLPMMTLIYKQTNKDAENWEKTKKPYDFPLNHMICITEQGYEYINNDKKMEKKPKNLSKDPLVFGRENLKFPVQADILFHNLISTISRKQFHLTTKNRLNESGYYITDLSAINPTTFRVRKTPFALNAGMLIELNTHLFEIMEVSPNVNDENDEDYIYMPTDGRESKDSLRNTLRKLGGEIEEPTKEDEHTIRKKRRKTGSAIEKPSLKLRIVNCHLNEEQDEDRYIPFNKLDKIYEVAKHIVMDKENITITGDSVNKFYMISVGSDKDNHIIIHDKENINNYYCQIYYDQNQKGWFIVEQHPESKQTEHSIGTLILLKSFSQFKDQKIGSIGYKLRDGMEIFFNYHVFEVKLKKDKK